MQLITITFFNWLTALFPLDLVEAAQRERERE